MRLVLDAESEAAAYRNVGMGPEAEAPPVRLSPWGHRQRGRGTRKDVPAGNGTGRSQGQLLPQHAADTECSQCCGPGVPPQQADSGRPRFTGHVLAVPSLSRRGEKLSEGPSYQDTVPMIWAPASRPSRPPKAPLPGTGALGVRFSL